MRDTHCYVRKFEQVTEKCFGYLYTSDIDRVINKLINMITGEAGGVGWHQTNFL